MLYCLVNGSGALLAWAATEAALPTPPDQSAVIARPEWDTAPSLPYVWTPAALNWTIPAPARVGWSPLTFRWRYSAAEQIAIELAAWGTAGDYTDAQRAELRIIEKSLDQVQTMVFPDDPRTQYGVGKHLELGLITALRAGEILNPAWSPPWAPPD